MAIDPRLRAIRSGNIGRGNTGPSSGGGAAPNRGGSSGGSDDTETITETTVNEPPQFPPGFGPVLLGRQQFANQQLRNLAGMRGQQMIAPFNQNQLDAFNSAQFLLDRPGMKNFFMNARLTGRETASGGFRNRGLEALEGMSGRADVPSQATTGLQALAQQAQAPQGSAQARQGLGRLQALSGDVSGDARGLTGLSGLAQTASGNAIDAPGFQNAFEAAVRRAQPQISSQFALSGRTGSGLEDVAQTQAAADAFAGLFNQERGRQVAASQGLANFLSQQRGRQTDAASTLADFFGRQQGQQIAAATPLAQLFDSAQGRQLQAAQSAAGARRARQSLKQQGANQLPGLVAAAPRFELEIGNQIQDQRQRELEAPFNFQQGLTGLATGSLQSIPAISGGSTVTRPLLEQGQAGPSDAGGLLTGGLGLLGIGASLFGGGGGKTTLGGANSIPLLGGGISGASVTGGSGGAGLGGFF